MASASARMTADGRVEFPLAIRRAVGLERGGNVAIEVADKELRLRQADDAEAAATAANDTVEIDELVRDLQAMSRVLLGDYSGSAVDALIAERRLEFAREEAKLARYGR